MERTRGGNSSWPVALLVVLALCALSFLGAKLLAGSGMSAYGSYQTVMFTSNQGVQTVSHGFVLYDGTTLALVNAAGKTSWSYMIGTGYSFQASEHGIAAWNGSTLTLLDTDAGKAMYSGSMEAEVISAYVGGVYSAVVLGPEDQATIVLMNKEGGKLTPTIDTGGQTVLDFGFFYNDSIFWSLTLDSDGTVPTTTISTYNPGRTHVGSITNTDQLMYQVLFQSSRIVTVGETYLKIYDYTGTETTDQRQLIYGWYLMDADTAAADPLMAFAASGQAGDGSRIKDARMMRTGVDQIVHFPYGCTALYARGDRVYGFSEDGLVMEARVGQPTVNAYELPVSASKVYGVLTGGVAVLGSGSTIYLVPLP